MLIPRFVVGILQAVLMVLGAGLVSGQDYPNKPIRIVVGEAGGGGDLVARVIAQGLSASLSQSVIVDNRGGTIAVRALIVVKAPADGYTLQLIGGSHWLLPLLRDNLPYDPLKDYAPITLAGNSPNILVVHPSLPVNSVKELIDFTKAKPGQINYASGATATPIHLAAELFKTMAGVNIVRIPYRGTAPALIGLMGGEAQMMFTPTAVSLAHVKLGKLRALAVTSAQPSALVPGLPTMAASGLAGYESVSIHGICAPAKTPATIINRLNLEIVRLLNMPDPKAKLFNSSIDVVGSSPEQFAAAIKSEMTRMGKVIKDAGIREE